MENSDDIPRYVLCAVSITCVGIRYYKGVVHQGEYVSLRREPHNRYDANAIEIVNRYNEKVGYVRRMEAAVLAPIMDIMTANASPFSSIHDPDTTAYIRSFGVKMIDGIIPYPADYRMPITIGFYGDNLNQGSMLQEYLMSHCISLDSAHDAVYTTMIDGWENGRRQEAEWEAEEMDEQLLQIEMAIEEWENRGCEEEEMTEQRKLEREIEDLEKGECEQEEMVEQSQLERAIEDTEKGECQQEEMVEQRQMERVIEDMENVEREQAEIRRVDEDMEEQRQMERTIEDMENAEHEQAEIRRVDEEMEEERQMERAIEDMENDESEQEWIRRVDEEMEEERQMERAIEDWEKAHRIDEWQNGDQVCPVY